MSDLDRLYAEGVAALRKGDKALAKEKLTQVVEQDQFHEQAWLWLSGAVDNDEERIICLQNVLTINPDNEPARSGLARLGADAPARVAPDPPLPPDPPSPPSGPPSSSVGSEILGTDLHSTVSGLAKETIPVEEPPSDDDVSWRMQLDASTFESSSAALFEHEEPPQKRTLSDLAAVWADMLYFNVYGGFEDEIKHGGFAHVLVNIVAASFLQIIGAVILFLMLSVVPSTSYQPPFLRSLTEFVANAAGTDILAAGPSDLGLVSIAVDPIEEDIVQRLAQAGEEISGLSLVVAAILGTVLIIYAILSIPINFFTQMYQSLLTNFVARWLQGKGDAIETMHALTIALVVAQIVQLPITLLIPFISVWAALIIWIALGLYQFAVTAVAVGTVHKFGLFLSFGAIILSNALGNFVAGLASFALTILLSV